MKKQAFCTLLLLPVVWGAYYVATSRAVGALSVFSAGIVIRFVTLVLLSLLMLYKKELGTLLRLRSIWPRLFFIGLLGFLLDVTAFIGLSMCPAGIGTALLKCDVLFVNLISATLYHYTFRKRDWAYTLVMLFGVILVLNIDFHSFAFNWGYVFFLLSALFVSINAFLIQNVQHDKENPAGDHLVAYYNNLITMVLFVAMAFLNGDIALLPRVWEANAFVPLLLAGLCQTLVYIVYYYNLRRYPVWLVKVFLLLMPVISTLLSLLLFKEQVSLVQWAGIVILLLGAAGLISTQRSVEKAPQ